MKLQLLPALLLSGFLSVTGLRAGTPSDMQSAATTTAPGNQGLIEDFLRPSVILTYTHDFDSDFKDAPGQMSLDEAEATIPLPVLHSGGFVFIPTLYYRFDEMTVNTSGFRGTFDLHTIRVPMQAAFLFDSPWFVYVFAEPGFSSDFHEINSESIDMSASLDIGYRFSPDFVLALGAYYTRDYGRDRLYPSLGLLWKINDCWSIDVTPVEAASIFKFGEDWLVKAKVIAYGGRWTIEDQQRIELTGARVGADIERRLWSKAWLVIGGGVTLLNEMRVEDGPNQELFDRDLKPGAYVTGSLRWEF